MASEAVVVTEEAEEEAKDLLQLEMMQAVPQEVPAKIRTESCELKLWSPTG